MNEVAISPTTVDVVKAYLLELSYENPDKRADCFYSKEYAYEATVLTGMQDYDDDGHVIAYNPCCIVGQMAYDFRGVEGLRKLKEEKSVAVFDILTAKTTNSRYSNATILRDELDFTPEAIVLASYAQREQDNGKTWGEAVPIAIEKYEAEAGEIK